MQQRKHSFSTTMSVIFAIYAVFISSLLAYAVHQDKVLHHPATLQDSAFSAITDTSFLRDPDSALLNHSKIPDSGGIGKVKRKIDWDKVTQVGPDPPEIREMDSIERIYMDSSVSVTSSIMDDTFYVIRGIDKIIAKGTSDKGIIWKDTAAFDAALRWHKALIIKKYGVKI